MGWADRSVVQSVLALMWNVQLGTERGLGGEGGVGQVTLRDVAWRGRAAGSCLAVICLVGGTVALVAIVTLGKNVEVCHGVGWLALWDGQTGAWCRRARGVLSLMWNVQLMSTERGLGGGGGAASV